MSETDTKARVMAVFADYQREIQRCSPTFLRATAQGIAASLTAAHFSAATFDPLAPVNAYGENFTDAIQNSHERGLRGIQTP